MAARAKSRLVDRGPAEVRDLMRRQIGDALRVLRTRTIPADETIHQARKNIKRARASLRLLRDAIGEQAYERENALLRGAGRPLSQPRDAKVALDTIERLRAHEHGTRVRDELARLRREMRRRRLRLRRELRSSGDLKETRRSLVKAGEQARRWRLSRHDPKVLVAGVGRIYRKGRKALERTESDESDENLHESRKQVKYLEQAMEVIGHVTQRRRPKLLKRASAIGGGLGADHDLAVLGMKIAALPANSVGTRKNLISHIERRRRKLQSKALKKGRRLYRRKAKAFRDRLESRLAAGPGA
ncbi:MAG TPA: CHAD domain-containing protein [Burkholderiales bacterium]|nr:CHAD domain-containing protein [Burkholderiales bacterium]